MMKAARAALRVNDGDRVDERPSGDDCRDPSETSAVAMAGNAVVMAASAMGIGTENLTTMYRA